MAVRTTALTTAIVLFPLLRQVAAQEIDSGTEAEITLPAIEVTATPLPGGGVDRDRIPATVRSVTGEDFARNPPTTITETIFQLVPGVSVSDPNGNAVAQELNYRGFSASSLQGAPQGLAVYMNGIRLNEAFGDTVNWDLIPTNVIERADLWTNNPVFGLNALGGAINLSDKERLHLSRIRGRTCRAARSDASPARRSMARISATAPSMSPVRCCTMAAGGSGRRSISAAPIGDIGWRDDRAELHLVGSAATASFGAAAATPVDLLELDRRAVYTTPQTTDNSAGSLALNGKFSRNRHLAAARQCLCPAVSAKPRRRQPRRCRAMQQQCQSAVSQSPLPAG